MIKKRALIVFTVIPLILGYVFAHHTANRSANSRQEFYYNKYVQSNDKITLARGGDIFIISSKKTKQITHNAQVIEPLSVGNQFAAIVKTTNYSSLNLYDQSGSSVKTLFNGNTGKIDTMSWITDPAVNSEQTKIAYVSDKDKAQTGVPDNALYILNLATGKSTHIAKPDPYSGGLAHPVWDPVDSNILLYDYYQYDPTTLAPYSTIMEYDKSTGHIAPLTTNKQNAYHAAFSPDGKHILFLIRNADTLSVSLYIADISEQGLSNEHLIATGDFAYPEFSNSSGYIYFLKATDNSGYNLIIAIIQKNKLSNEQTVFSGNTLLGTSPYEISKMSQ